MEISAIIPALNEAARIDEAIHRAWQAGVEEVIVVDGGSDDGTADWARRRRCVVIESSSGRAVQQNAGARAATGDVLLFVHADTHLAAGAAAQIRAALAADPALEAGAFRQRIDAHGLTYRWLEAGNALRVRWRSLAYGDQGLFVRRAAFDAVGGFAEVPLLEDLLLSRSLRRRHRLALLPGPLHVSARRWRRYGVVRQTLRNWTILTAHRWGVSPARLAAWYRRHDQ